MGTVWKRLFDYLPVHNAKSIKKWFDELCVAELQWPAQSPDLNPTEHFCDELECLLQARPSYSTSVTDLAKALLTAWAQIHTQCSDRKSVV